jgi:hypothetical protein
LKPDTILIRVREKKVAKYDYYAVVENSFVVRVKSSKAERLEVKDGRRDWVPYSDLWDVWTNGRQVSEKEAMEAARYFSEEEQKKQILEERKKRRAQRQK